ncbi:phosphoadenylyl-sulfate reductase [Chryseobacterium nematophagum]|uniref:Adenosine 5'-phosphosulfate reductase n=1 Tax=Chryseobacterium nematophagum TaxID=2305228 RepID=A0A3M7TGW3_9FLAO|nr:phosphoadenylyl-sulfate reductase [Chryseobacterium nematophagum]RNA62755.1 phosphoadenylyl-sulfate reductase [Chryseobacterium nematophagum]
MISIEDVNIIKQLSAEEGLKFISSKFSEGLVFSTSLGQEDQVILDIISKNDLPVKVFTLDTGRLFYEHYELLSNNNSKYKTKIEVHFPNAADVEKYVNEKGVNAFYHSVEDRKECCFIRKVKPLNQALKNANIWITGLRAEQSENRENMSIIEWDEERMLYKYNPLIQWNYQEVLHYLEQNKVQELSLHKKGFISVGCQPCTRAVEEGENPRTGRWWWESSHKECGLHR